MNIIFKRLFSSYKTANTDKSETPIWPNTAPGSEGKSVKEKIRIIAGEKIISAINQPAVIPYLPSPENAKGTAVIIAPGGGHKELWIDHEGHHPARILCALGIAAFVLKYRLTKEEHSTYTMHEHALADMQQAIRFVRAHANEYKINPARIGVMGFSAGGELAALSAMHFDDGEKTASGKIAQQSSYPNFQALIYPSGTDYFRATNYSPPLFLLSGNDDEEVSQGITEMYLKYAEAGIPAELHIYVNEGHGFGVRKNNNAAIAKWPERFIDWLSAINFLKTD